MKTKVNGGKHTNYTHDQILLLFLHKHAYENQRLYKYITFCARLRIQFDNMLKKFYIENYVNLEKHPKLKLSVACKIFFDK